LHQFKEIKTKHAPVLVGKAAPFEFSSKYFLLIKRAIQIPGRMLKGKIT
jgi:hypothetical protein